MAGASAALATANPASWLAHALAQDVLREKDVVRRALVVFLLLLTAAAAAQRTAQPPGLFKLKARVGGVAREAYVHVPASHEGEKLPLILNLHGAMNSAFVQEKFSDMNRQAGRRGYIVVHPEGRPGKLG